MTTDYQIDVKLTEATTWTNIFSESYRIALLKELVENTTPKEHGFKTHVESFVTQLKRNSNQTIKKPLKKRDIFVVSYGMNTGSEINGDRPSIIYKDSKSTLGDDLTVIPLTSAVLEKQSDAFDIYVGKDEVNNLYQNSRARLRQLRSVSVKRLGKFVWSITDDKVTGAINARVKEMLWTEA